jgi:hypothetical protein
MVFMHKVPVTMLISQKHPLSKIVHIDEFEVGVKEDGKQGGIYNKEKQKQL